ncbi:Nucleoside-diphosphate-sugar pyrophosphorylase family protein [Frateuria aurantia DSM 6220]|uniref:Nucleoside-diphosphate-sugar pyrophosphorylase family protein n=1 Tax=Frateuria aurantia (strain ATCC 33424 / DSM 6220 / KCTC 2777 / LMG 1558 / NBRC 3245 / NCIMB 13370) TaxID=767434 RepID=H8L0B6_FRAAD|nr:Nucleoside-diphosphate-sugar pyrophosphorylase family protein [Frateuria aurantia DSM 6220]
MSNPYFLILSGSYVGDELIAEFGRIPPSMLPNGGKPLYEDQIKLAQSTGARILLALPIDYEISPFDQRRFTELGVTIIRTLAEGDSIDSLRACLDATEGEGAAYVLFGDTLIKDFSTWSTDSFAVGTIRHTASWGEYVQQGSDAVFRMLDAHKALEGEIIAGAFLFESLECLRKAVHADSFINALADYNATRRLSAIQDPSWLDFGHLFTYHQSRCRELLARSFNSVKSDGFSVVKTGTPSRKIYAEAMWFQNLPRALDSYTPRYMGFKSENPIAYELEYLHFPLISELYCFSSLPEASWQTMIGSCVNFLEAMQDIRPKDFEVPAHYPKLFFDDIIALKTRQRLETFGKSHGLDLDREWTVDGKPYLSLRGLADQLIQMVKPSQAADISMWHGDFHFANIFYDFRSNRVRVVDPRGMLSNGMLTQFGDARYDIAKLGHSIYGMYDFLIAGRYSLNYDRRYDISLCFGEDSHRQRVMDIYSELQIGRYATTSSETVALVALLFLSMLPLHDHGSKRQMAMLANAFRLSKMAEMSR